MPTKSKSSTHGSARWVARLFVLALLSAWAASAGHGCSGATQETSGTRPPAPTTTKNAPPSSLAGWRDTASKAAILDFVRRVTEVGSPDFVPPAERIAVFDNDGTLWAEQPVYFQAAYLFDRVRELAGEHPEWNTKAPFSDVLAGHPEKALAGGQASLLALLAATHGGVTSAELTASMHDWLGRARHPQRGVRYVDLVYGPMLELLAYLRAHGFETFIVSGGGADFMRVFAEERYGIPPEQVIGSRMKAEYRVDDGVPFILKRPELEFVDDGPGKPVAIHQHIGRRPIAAFGNSDGDFEMLEWTTSAPGARLGVLIHHDDAEREWAYDRDSSMGKLDRGLDEAEARGWVVVSMARDWDFVFPEIE